MHFGTPASGETFPPNKVLVTEAFRYFSCSSALFVAENKEPHLEHLKKISRSLDTVSEFPAVPIAPRQSIEVAFRVLKDYLVFARR